MQNKISKIHSVDLTNLLTADIILLNPMLTIRSILSIYVVRNSTSQLIMKNKLKIIA